MLPLLGFSFTNQWRILYYCIFSGGESLLFAFHTMDTSLDKFDYLEHLFTILFRLYEIEDMQHANQVSVSVQY